MRHMIGKSDSAEAMREARFMRHRMRDARLSAAAALSAVLPSRGCGKPGGVDGDLTNGWGRWRRRPASSRSPGTCHLANFDAAGPRATYEEIDCALPHRTETVFVGDVPAPGRGRRRAAGRRLRRRPAAYQTCDEKTTDVRRRPVAQRPALDRRDPPVARPPGPAAPAGSAARCCELDSVEDDGGLVQRTGSLRGALADGAADLMLGCYAIELDDAGAIGTMPPAACTGKHNAEFVGVWTADKAWPTRRTTPTGRSSTTAAAG